MRYEAICTECHQIYDVGLMKGRICTYCWSIKGLDHAFIKEDVRIFGEIPGAANTNIKFTGWWDK